MTLLWHMFLRGPSPNPIPIEWDQCIYITVYHNNSRNKCRDEMTTTCVPTHTHIHVHTSKKIVSELPYASIRIDAILTSVHVRHSVHSFHCFSTMWNYNDRANYANDFSAFQQTAYLVYIRTYIRLNCSLNAINWITCGYSHSIHFMVYQFILTLNLWTIVSISFRFRFGTIYILYIHLWHCISMLFGWSNYYGAPQREPPHDEAVCN